MHSLPAIPGIVLFLLFAICACGFLSNLSKYRRLVASRTLCASWARRRVRVRLCVCFVGVLMFGGSFVFAMMNPVASSFAAQKPQGDVVESETQTEGFRFMTVNASTSESSAATTSSSEVSTGSSETRGYVSFMPLIPARVSDF